MTIGIGIKCTDGIVLCSDTLITVQGSHKFYLSKIYPIDFPNNAGRVCFTYAGEPDLMKTFTDKLLWEIQSDHCITSVQGARELIEDVLQQIEREIINSADRGYPSGETISKVQTTPEVLPSRMGEV